jgi:hypothetical protein
MRQITKQSWYVYYLFLDSTARQADYVHMTSGDRHREAMQERF